MSTTIAAKNAQFISPIDHVRVGNRAGLIAEHYFGRTLDSSVTDYSGGPSLSIVGSPVVMDNEVFIPDGNSGLSLALTNEPQYFTMFFVGRRENDGSACSFFSALGGATTGIVQTVNGSNTGFRARDDGNSTNNQVILTGNAATQNEILTMRVRPISGGFKISARSFDGTAVIASDGDFLSARPTDHTFTRDLSIGYGGALFNGALYARAALLYNRGLSDAEVRDVERYLQRWCL